jgi:nitrogen fixation/metabolism regulation signal transduction histidine kinase
MTAALAVAFAMAALVSLIAWRRTRALLVAVEQALLSLSERDYSVRLIEEKVALGPLARNFNRLGERLRSEHSERYQREILLETVLEATPAAVILFDSAQVVVFANSAARELFAGGADLLGQSSKEVRERAPSELGEMLSGSSEGLVTVERSDGSDTFHVAQRHLELRYQPHRLVLVKPLSRELVRKEAEAWKRAIRVISHEINNSLAPMVSLIHTAKKVARKPELADKLDQALDTVLERAQHLQRFFDGYAEFARLPKPVREPVRWRPLLEQLRVLYPFSDDGVVDSVAQLDPAQIQHVLVNLIKNAIESGSPTGEIRVAIRTTENGHLLEVSDRGAGIHDEVLKKALVPFYSTKKSGTGLGLPLCREIVEAHGGHLSIESQPGRGTTVRCYLPDAAGVS